MVATDLDIEPRREAVWLALSEFWLDTELDEADLGRIAELLKGSGYSQEELTRILTDEVAPVVWTNLFPFYPTIPEVWTEFDPDWLKENIQRNLHRQTQSRIYRFWITGRIFRRMRTSMIKPTWERCLLQLQQEERATQR